MSAPVRVTLPDEARVIALSLIGLGLTVSAAGLALSPARTWPILLLGNLYVLSLALAGAIVLCTQYLSGAGWSVVLRRVPEAMMSGLPVVAVLMLLVFFGRQTLYPWAGPEAAGHAPMPADKALYLSAPFVFARMVLVLALWVWLARAIRKRRCGRMRIRPSRITRDWSDSRLSLRWCLPSPSHLPASTG